jgi:hypothetical protein
MTGGPAARVAAVLSLVREVADEIVVALDDRAGEDVRDAMAAVADQILLYPYAEPVDRPVPWLHTQCRGDWVLNLDDDEIPAPDLVAALPDLVRAEDVTHYWIPRRWLFPDLDTYLDELPWRPDYQLRLVRNDPRLLRFSADLHRPLAVLGPRRFLEFPVWHLDCVVRPVEARREKVRKYERLRPGLRLGGRGLNAAYFLPELLPEARLARVPEADRAAIDAVMAAEPPRGIVGDVEERRASREEIDRLWPGRPLGHTAYRAELEFLVPGISLTAGERRAVDVRVANRGDAVWSWGDAGEPSIRLASRWRGGTAAKEAPTVRTPLPADVAPGTETVVPVHVSAPCAPGLYELEVDLVHEHARWFGCAIAMQVQVLPRQRIGIVGGDEAAQSVLRLLDQEPELEPILVARDSELPWEQPGHLRVPGVRSYLFGGDPDRPGSIGLVVSVASRSAALVLAARRLRGQRADGRAHTPSSFLEALADCRLLVIVGLDAPPGSPAPRELARLVAIVRAARACGVPVALRGDALPSSPRRLVRALAGAVRRRATLVYDDDEELARALAQLGDRKGT